MSVRGRIEELRDELARLRSDVASLHRYGSAAGSLAFLDKLTDCDKRILLYVAVTEGDADVVAVAEYLMKSRFADVQSFDELIQDLPSDILKVLSPKRAPRVRSAASMRAGAKLVPELAREALARACEQMGALDFEDAYWIVLRSRGTDQTQWIQAIDMGDSAISDVRFSSQTVFDPDYHELHELLAEMREADLVLHVHNHPGLHDDEERCRASQQDLEFAAFWVERARDVGATLKFFVIADHCAIEYTARDSMARRWIWRF